MKLLLDWELPGLNEYIAAIARNRYAGGAIKREQTELVMWACRGQQLEVRTKPVFISFHWYMKNKKKDIDNVAFAKKFILDGLVVAGILYDDSQEWVKGFEDHFSIDPKRPRVEVVLRY